MKKLLLVIGFIFIVLISSQLSAKNSFDGYWRNTQDSSGYVKIKEDTHNFRIRDIIIKDNYAIMIDNNRNEIMFGPITGNKISLSSYYAILEGDIIDNEMKLKILLTPNSTLISPKVILNRVEITLEKITFCKRSSSGNIYMPKNKDLNPCGVKNIELSKQEFCSILKYPHNVCTYNFPTKEERIAKAKKKEEERIAKAKKKEEERIAKAKKKEEERIAKAKKKEEERIAKAKKKEEERIAIEIQSNQVNSTKSEVITQVLNKDKIKEELKYYKELFEEKLIEKSEYDELRKALLVGLQEGTVTKTIILNKPDDVTLQSQKDLDILKKQLELEQRKVEAMESQALSAQTTNRVIEEQNKTIEDQARKQRSLKLMQLGFGLLGGNRRQTNCYNSMLGFNCTSW